MTNESGAMQGPRGGGSAVGERNNRECGQRWSQTVKISWFESQGALPALGLAFLCEIIGFWAGL
jgi:hypothetical protein